MSFRRLIIAAALAAAIAPARAEPASPDPALFAAETAVAPRATLADFDLGGAALSFSARGRAAALDTYEAREDLDDARALRGFLPGYPQPAQMTFDVKVWF